MSPGGRDPRVGVAPGGRGPVARGLPRGSRALARSQGSQLCSGPRDPVTPSPSKGLVGSPEVSRGRPRPASRRPARRRVGVLGVRTGGGQCGPGRAVPAG